MTEPADAPTYRYADGVLVALTEAEITAITKRPTIARRKELLFTALSAKRREIETGGITVDGSVIRTDAGSQAKLTGAVTLAQSDQTLTSIDWEAQPGVWVLLDAPTIVAMGVTVGRFVQACFSNARVLSQQISSASTHAALDAIDLNVGWPS